MIPKQLRTVLIDLNIIDLFKMNVNDRNVRNIPGYLKFYKSLFIIIKNQLDFVDCELQLNYSKRRIHLNLLDSDQIKTFISICKNSIA